MKIAVWHNLPSGGANRAMYGHLRGLVRRGHTVEVWHPPTADTKYLPLTDLAVEHCVPLDGVWPAKGRLGRLGGEYSDARRMLTAVERHCARCAEEMNRGGFDLLFAQEARFVPAPPLPKYIRMPTVLYMQQPNRVNFEQTFTPGTLPWIGGDEFAAGAWKHPKHLAWGVARQMAVRLKARLENEWARSYDRVLANSLFSRESILKAYGVDAKICYLGIDTDRFKNLGRPRERFVVGLGEIGPHKNVAMAIRAMATLAQPRPPLVWIANNTHPGHREQMAALAATLGVDFQVKAAVGDDELVRTLNCAWAMVYAPRLEPFGLAPLEANACGTPVVAVAEGGVRETIRDGVNGLLVEHDPDAMGRALARLLNDEAYARQLGDGGVRVVAEQWTDEAAIDHVERRLSDVLAERPLSPAARDALLADAN